MAVLSHEGTFAILYGSWPIPFGTRHKTGYIARPDAAGKFPVVMVIPSAKGLSSAEKDLCRRLARNGLATVCLDPFVPDGSDPMEAYNRLSDLVAMADLEEGHQFLTSPDVEWSVSGDVGVLGIDVGGRLAIELAATRPWVKALAVAYAPLTGDEEREFQVAERLSHLPVPVLGIYGAADSLIDPVSVDEAQRRNEHGQWLLYQDAGHGFLDPSADQFDEAAADDAVARMVAFFTATLPAAEVLDLG